MKKTIIFAALVAAGSVHAACAVHVHVGAYHTDPGYESVTPGIGGICDTPWPDVRAAAGVFRNSIRNTSVYAGAAWQPVHVGPARLGVFGGAITGYNRGLMPMAAGIVSFPINERAGVNVIVLPSVKGLTPFTVAFSFEVKL
jgi:hypothetical protein